MSHPQYRDGPSTRSELGAAALTMVLCLLLIDAAVETFLSGAPVRWWVAGVVAASLSLMAAGWWRGTANRFGWPRRATASFFVLLGLLAWTVWLPDGLSNGMAMLRQPTPVVLSAVSAVAVAGAGLVLVRVRLLPWWGRAAFGLLALYGVAAFAVGVIEAVPYPSLFQGESLWRRLPYWLQGAFIGTLVAVPLAMVAAIVDAFRQLRAAEGRGWGIQQSLALGLATVMAVSGFTMSAGPVSGVAGPGRAGSQLSAGEISRDFADSYAQLTKASTVEGPGGASAQDAADRLGSVFAQLEAAQRELPRDTFDPKALVATVGNDAQKLLEWVREYTALVPYRGALRGHTGVLMDRLGNSLDRALLLYALLRAAGHDARLARGQLSESQALQLLNRLAVEKRPSGDQGAGSNRRSVVPATAPVERELLAFEREHERVVVAVQQRVAAQFSELSKITERDMTPRLEQPATIEALRDHWWVQWHDGSHWTDLDPTGPSGTASVPPVDETMQPSSPGQLPEALQHVVKIRVIAEQWRNGKLVERPVLSHTLRPMELYGTRVVLSHFPLHSPTLLDFVGTADPEGGLKAAVLAHKEWLPVLRIGSEAITQFSVTDSGDVNETPLAPLIGSAAQNMGRGIAGLLSRETGGGPPSRSSGDSNLSAGWIEYEVQSPGQPVRTVRRDLFDLVGIAARSAGTLPRPIISDAARLDRGLAMMGYIEILPLVSQPSKAFVENLLAATLLNDRDRLLSIVRESADHDIKSLARRLGELTPLPSSLYGLAIARAGWRRGPADDIYLDRPNVLTRRSQPRVNRLGQLVTLGGFDIVANDVALRPGAAGDPLMARLEQGVLDTNVEAALAVSGCPGSADRDCGGIENTAELAAASDQQGIKWILLKTPQDSATEVNWPSEVRARVEQDLAAGYLVVAPSKEVLVNGVPTLAWWRVDRSTGNSLGIGKEGWGQTATEQILTLGVFTFAFVGHIVCIMKIAEKPSGSVMTIGRIAWCMMYLFSFASGAEALGGKFILIIMRFLNELGIGGGITPPTL